MTNQSSSPVMASNDCDEWCKRGSGGGARSSSERKKAVEAEEEGCQRGRRRGAGEDRTRWRGGGKGGEKGAGSTPLPNRASKPTICSYTPSSHIRVTP